MPSPSPSEDLAAHEAFVEWASRQAGAPRDPGALVTDTEVSYDYIGLLATELHGRRVVWKSIPASSRERVTFPPIAIESIDPWSVDADTLRARSDHVAICDTCAGDKTMRCASCGGAGKTLCAACGGQRKMYGYAANGSYRLLNCTSCRGKGEIDCPECRRGIAVCSACAGEGRVQRWIELEWWRRPVTSTYPEALAQQFETVTRDAEVTVDIDRPHRLVPADLGNIPAQWLGRLAPRRCRANGSSGNGCASRAWRRTPSTIASVATSIAPRSPGSISIRLRPIL